MRRIVEAATVGLGLTLLATALRAGDGGSCTGPGGGHCVPRCSASWAEEKTKKPEYAIRCEHACARGRDAWHAPDPECRCQPPCGQAYVKKRLYKSEGAEHVERVPKYGVTMVPAPSCGCAQCAGGRTSGWDPLGLMSLFHLR